MYDICSIGHITNDKVVTSKTVKYMPGGTAFYFSKALQNLDVNCLLLTAVFILLFEINFGKSFSFSSAIYIIDFVVNK